MQIVGRATKTFALMNCIIIFQGPIHFVDSLRINVKGGAGGMYLQEFK